MQTATLLAHDRASPHFSRSLPNRPRRRPRSRLPWTRETHRLSATFKDRERRRLGRQTIPR